MHAPTTAAALRTARAAATLAVALCFASAAAVPTQAQAPTFDSFCEAEPHAAFVTASLGFVGSRFLYKYTAEPDNSTSLVALGEIQAPINAVGFYEGYLYGLHRTDGTLYQVDGDANIMASQAVPNLPVGANRAYTSGSVDKENGIHYVFARGFAKAYKIDLNDVQAGATKLTFLVDGVRTLLDFADFVYSDGFLYGYEPNLSRGFKIDAATGDTELFEITGPFNEQIYPAAWISPEGTLFLYKTSDEVYELDISGPTWVSQRALTGVTSQRAQRDGAACPARFVPSCPDPSDYDGDGEPDACAPTFAACDAIHLIQARVNAFDLPRGTANQLNAKLDNADRKCHREQFRVVRNMMGGFVNTVEANFGGAIPTEQAAELLARGQAVVHYLGDPPGGPAIIPFGDPIGWDHEGDEKDHGNGRGNLVAGAPAELAFVGVYPNPVRAEATVRFAVPEAGDVAVTVYDVMGREVAVSTARFEAGEHGVALGADRLPAGLYVARVTTAAATATGTFIVAD